MQFVFIIIGIVIFVSFFVALFDGVLNFGNTAGMVLGGGYIVLGLLIGRFDSVNQKLIAVSAVGLLLLLVYKMYEIYKAGKTTAGGEAVVIVLGCRVKGDQPSLALIKRADAAYQFLLNNPNSVAILSGGQGRDENLSEALCMQNLLYNRGIAKDRLILEDKSTSTDENIRFSLAVMAQLDMKKEAAIATSEYHQKRAAVICKKYGLKSSTVSSHTKLTLLPTFLLRELFGEIKEKLIK